MIRARPTSSWMADVIARKSSTAYDGVPSGRRAWMWIITPPSSAIRRASAAYSAGVHGQVGGGATVGREQRHADRGAQLHLAERRQQRVAHPLHEVGDRAGALE